MDDYELKLFEQHKNITGYENIGPVYHARSEFTCGLCGVFAAALHDKTGWKIFAEYENEILIDIVHIWVVNESDQAVDINGTHRTNFAATPFTDLKQKNRYILPFARDQCMNDNCHVEYQWATEIISEFSSLYGIENATISTPKFSHLKF